MTFAYLRVSTDKQDYMRQLGILEESGYEVEERNIFCDTKSGKDTDREQYQLLRRFVRKGDQIIFCELSRMSRSYSGIATEMTYYREKGVKLIFLDMPFLNLDTDDLTQQLINDIAIKLFSYVAEVERENTRRRIQQKLDELRKDGVKLGRPDIVLSPDQEEILLTYILKKPGYMGGKETAEVLGLKYGTFCHFVTRYRREHNLERIIRRPDKER